MIISFGAYFKNHTHFERVVFIVDIFLISSLCFAIGMLLSSIINEYMTEDLDRSKKKILFSGK